MNNRADKTWLFDRVGCDKNFKHEWVHEWMRNINCPSQIALVSHKDDSPCGLSLWPRRCPPRMLLYPFISIQVFHQSLLFVCVPQVQIYQKHSFCQGTEGWIGPLRMEFLENTFKFLGTGHLMHIKGIPCQLSYMLLTAWVLH